MRYIAAFIILFLFIISPLHAEPELNQFVTTSWDGLAGLFVIPTARMIGAGNSAFGFNEAKHTEFVNDIRAMDRQIRAVVTYGISDSVEIYGSYFNNLLSAPRSPALDNQDFNEFGFKVKLVQECRDCWYPAVALGVRDIGDSTADVGSLQNIHNGRKVFLLASKKIFKKRQTGRFMDVHGALAYDANAVSGLLGFELTITPNASLIAEFMYDSPFINFRDYGTDDQSGRFVFNPGIRFYPELVPGLALDLGFIGDSEFEFSFGASYLIHL